MHDKTLPKVEALNPQRTGMGPCFSRVGGEIYNPFMMEQRFVGFASGKRFWILLGHCQKYPQRSVFLEI